MKATTLLEAEKVMNAIQLKNNYLNTLEALQVARATYRADRSRENRLNYFCAQQVQSAAYEAYFSLPFSERTGDAGLKYGIWVGDVHFE